MIHQSLTSNSSYHSLRPEVVVRLAVVPAEAELITISLEVPLRHMVKYPMNASFQQGKIGLGVVDVNTTQRGLSEGVIDLKMTTVKLLAYALVALPLVRRNRCGRRGNILDGLVKRRGLQANDPEHSPSLGPRGTD